MPKVTLLSYFTKTTTPKSSPVATSKEDEKGKEENGMSPLQENKLNGNTSKYNGGKTQTENNRSLKKKKQKNECNGSTPKSDVKTKSEPQKKRRRIVVCSDSDSDEEYKPEANSDNANSESSESECEVSGESDPESPVKKRKKKNAVKNIAALFSPSTPKLKSPAVSDKTKSKLSSFAIPEDTTSPSVQAGKQWLHLQLQFLKDGKRRDGKGRLHTDPDYDPKTLKIPEDFRKSLTPAMRQWWELKSQHFDVVLFFKMGKFYELFHMDADVGVSELGLIYMKGDYAHSGFPEIAYGRYADTLIQKGYKVARVEQTETPQMMEERCKTMSQPTKFDRVVRREICQITTKGTKTSNSIDVESSEAFSSYLFAVTEKILEDSSWNCEFGVCFVDTTIGKFFVGQFVDDRERSRLRTLFSQYPPAQILFEKGKLNTVTHNIINNLTGNLKDGLTSGSEFWDSSKTLRFISDGRYFSTDSEKSDSEWPSVLKSMLSEDDSLGLTAKENYSSAISALGACTWYLMDCRLEQELLSMRNFEEYLPSDIQNESLKDSPAFTNKYMVLDGNTLRNLDIVTNCVTGTEEGTLLQKLDNCCTAFGKRLLRKWLCSPLCTPLAIVDRQNAIEDLKDHPEITSEASELLKKIPDLERLLSRIHTQGNAVRSKTHPDSRAIFYEENVYCMRKIESFLTALTGFEKTLEISKLFKKIKKFRSTLLKQCVVLNADGGRFPELAEHLTFFETAFDHKSAKKDGRIIPAKGVDEEYDHACAEIEQTNTELQAYLKKQCDFFGCKVTYFGTGKNRFQLEVPDHAAKHASDKYELQSQRKGFKRYWTPKIQSLLSCLSAAEELRDNASKDIMRRIFATFDKHFETWEAAVKCLGILDVLLSFTKYVTNEGVNMTRPEIVDPSTDSQPFIEIVNGYHPSITHLFSGDEFIPNDSSIGVEDTESRSDGCANVILVTGPNMGGKSTLIRQIGTLVVMAQLGTYVPAEVCRFTPVDRIFTRLGASDRIISGQSTFFVELSETSSVLHHATKHSLVLMDELGRGTSTYDGAAIAFAVIQELIKKGCRTLFSTHYHSLVENFQSSEKVKLGHMACMVENESEDDPSQETITFLYKFIPGACPKSYGFNAAKLASIPEKIIKSGFEKSKQLEEKVNKKSLFRNIFTTTEFPTEAINSL